MNALAAKPFQVLIMSEESRLGREAIEVSYALKQIISAGVRVFLYLTDTERTLDSPIEKAMLALQRWPTRWSVRSGVSARTTPLFARRRPATSPGAACSGTTTSESMATLSGAFWSLKLQSSAESSSSRSPVRL